MKNTLTLKLILGGLGLVLVSSSCHRSKNTVSAGKSTTSMQMVKKSDQRDTLLLPLEIKLEEIYDRVPVRVKQH
jgi:hypothetical protein